MTILPITYLGNLEYYYHLLKNDEVLIDHWEPYQKQTYRSRCEICGANGRKMLSVPVKRVDGQHTLIKNLPINYSENWQKDHLKAIESAYARTPYFEYYFDQISEIISSKHEFLFELTDALMLFIINKLGLTVKLHSTQEQHPITEDDLRVKFSNSNSDFQTHRYIQPFEERHGFQNNLSIIDLLFNEGPNSITILQESSLA